MVLYVHTCIYLCIIQQILHKYLIESLWWSWLWFCVLLDLSIDHGVLVLSAWGCLVLNGVGVSIQGVGRRWTIATKIEGARKIIMVTHFIS